MEAVGMLIRKFVSGSAVCCMKDYKHI